MRILKKTCLFSLALLLAACGDDDAEISIFTAPETYEFSSRTDPANPSSVDYQEATTRLVLIKELEYLIGSDYLQNLGAFYVGEIEKGDPGYDNAVEAAQEKIINVLNAIYVTGTKMGDLSLSSHNLYNLYDPDNNETAVSTPIKGIAFNTPPLFSSLSANVNLKEAMPGTTIPLANRKEDTSEGLFIGWDTDASNGDHGANEIVSSWVKKIARLATDGDLETKFNFSDEIDYQALISHFLLASIPYFQVSNNHLNSNLGLVASNLLNDEPKLSYTQLEHHWDMAFGYYGTLRTAKNESLERIIETHSSTLLDIDSLISASVFDNAAATAQRDGDATFQDIHFSENIINNFLEGRELITLNDPTLSEEEKNILISNRATNIINNWEKALAATLIHHINRTIDNGADMNETYYQHWAKMKAYALALQFNPSSTLNKDTLIDIHKKIKQAPHTTKSSINGYLKEIKDLRSTIQNIYNFSNENISRW